MGEMNGLRVLILVMEKFGSWKLPLLVVAATFPVWRWYGERMLDDADEPLGVLALMASVVWGFTGRAKLRLSNWRLAGPGCR